MRRGAKLKQRVAAKLRVYKRRIGPWMDRGRCGVAVGFFLAVAALFFADHTNLLGYWWAAAVIGLLILLVPPMLFDPTAKRPLIAGIVGTIDTTTTNWPSVFAVPLGVALKVRGLLTGLFAGGVVLLVAALTEPRIGGAVLVVEFVVAVGRYAWTRRKGRAHPKITAGEDAF